MQAKDTIDFHVTRVKEIGYSIIENAIDIDLIQMIEEKLLALEKSLAIKPSANIFEGQNTLRIYNLLIHGKLFEKIPVHDNIFPIVEGVLGKGSLVSSLSSISLLPGETEQPMHADDQLIPISKPHNAFICNTMWAITDFTQENGATRLLPSSHQKDHQPEPFEPYEGVIPAEMPRGSVLVYHGSLWHQGGANQSKSRRIGIAMNYCAGFLRQQENQQLGIPQKIAKQFSKKLQKLIGYDVYRQVIGHIDRKSPLYLLDSERKEDLPWSE